MAPQFQLQTVSSSLRADVVVLALSPEDLESGELLAADDGGFSEALGQHLKQMEFKAERGNVLVVPTLGRGPAAHLVVIGLGKKGEEGFASALLSEALAIGVRAALPLRPRQLAVQTPVGVNLRAAALGVALGAYKFDKYFHATPREKSTLQKLSLLVRADVSAADKREFALGLRVADGVCLARDLVNEPPNVLYPEIFAERAQEVARAQGLACKILDPKGIVKAGLTLHAAVGQGSAHGPYFIHLTYKPKNPKGRVAFVGKGLTFDSGGLCIKPMQGMADMKSDMAGGAAVLGVMQAVSALAPDIEVHGIIGAAENMPDGLSYRPADVIPSLAGKGVEIINTDAEGRLVLADALTYAARLQPDFIVDAATLTGATLISLGAPYSAFFTGVEGLASAMQSSSARAGESFWRMPLIEELAQQLKSDITDLKHTGDRYGGAISAALFLREFTEGVPWMHCDVPGATYRDRASGLHPKGGTGHAVLTFLDLIETHSRSPIVQAAAQSSATTTKKKGSSAGAAPQVVVPLKKGRVAASASKAKSAATKSGKTPPKGARKKSA